MAINPGTGHCYKHTVDANPAGIQDNVLDFPVGITHYSAYGIG